MRTGWLASLANALERGAADELAVAEVHGEAEPGLDRIDLLR